MADKAIGELTAATTIDDSALFVAEQQGKAVSISGTVIKKYAKSYAVPDYIRTAAEAVARKMVTVTGALEAAETSLYASGYSVNQIQTAIDTDGSIFNTIGFSTTHRLNSSGAAVEYTDSYYSGICTTGFIPVVAGDVVRIQGITFNAALTQAGNCYIWFYDESFNALGSFNALYATEEYHFTLDSEGNVTEFTVLNPWSSFDTTSVAYFRMSGYDIDADSIITVNEEIPETDSGDDTTDYEGNSSESYAGAAPFSLAFLTDLHWDDEDESRLEAAQAALKVISEQAPLDLVCFGGDYVHNWTEVSADDAKEDISNCRRVFADTVAPAIWLRGNHDGNGYPDERLTRAEIYNRIGRAQHTLDGYISNPADPFGGYGYIDFPNAKVRVIAVNTSDNDYMGMSTPASDSVTAELINCHNIGAVQLQWIADTALCFSDKEDAKDWSIIVLSHVPIYSESDWYNSHTYTDDNGNAWECNVVNLETLFAAYRDKTAFSVTINEETASKDFSGINGRAGTIVFVNGHGHAFNSVTHNGFTYITCPNACDNGEKASSDGGTYTKGSAGTAAETAFTLLCFDLYNGNVYTWAYGAGYDNTIAVEIVEGEDAAGIYVSVAQGEENAGKPLVVGDDGSVTLGEVDPALTVLSVTEETDGSVTITEILEGDASNIITVSADSSGNPSSVTANGVTVPITWTEAGA